MHTMLKYLNWNSKTFKCVCADRASTPSQPNNDHEMFFNIDNVIKYPKCEAEQPDWLYTPGTPQPVSPETEEYQDIKDSRIELSYAFFSYPLRIGLNRPSLLQRTFMPYAKSSYPLRDGLVRKAMYTNDACADVPVVSRGGKCSCRPTTERCFWTCGVALIVWWLICYVCFNLMFTVYSP